MNFSESIKTVFSKYAEFNGKASRPELWWWFLFLVLTSAAAQLIDTTFTGNKSGTGLLLGLWSLATLLPSLAVGVRRLRDAGLPWGHMFWLLVPIAGIIVLIILWSQPKKR